MRTHRRDSACVYTSNWKRDIPTRKKHVQDTNYKSTRNPHPIHEITITKTPPIRKIMSNEAPTK